MKRLLTLMIPVMLSFPSYAEWIKVTKSTSSGNTIYVDFGKIKKIDNFLYYYSLTNYKKPVFGDLSVIVYHQADCKRSRERGIRWMFHKQQMGQGDSITENTHDKEWAYPFAHTSSASKGAALKTACEQAVNQKL